MSDLGAGWVRWLLVGALAAGCGEARTEDPEAEGTPSGGRATGGAPSRGGDEGGAPGSEGGAEAAEAGATASGGATPSGGLSSGGGGSGGVASGGASAGGASTGGARTGGASTGGADTGGTSPLGGASGNGGTAGDGSGGAAAGAGGAGGLGGTSGDGGTPGSGGSAGAPASEVECDDPGDCVLSIADCVCRSLPAGDPRASDVVFCEQDPCAALDVTEANVTCLRGRCSLALVCDRLEVDCSAGEPACPDGQTALVTGGCWGPCVPVEECMPAPLGAGPDVFEGVWLIGWEDEARHFSALRFPPDAGTGYYGPIELLADPGLPDSQPIFPCSGVGEFMPTAAWGGFMIEQPADCDPEESNLYLVFQDFGDAGGRWGSTLHATIETIVESELRDLDAYWFPADTCDAAMTACTFGDP